jgi:hypothetical protein
MVLRWTDTLPEPSIRLIRTIPAAAYSDLSMLGAPEWLKSVNVRIDVASGLLLCSRSCVFCAGVRIALEFVEGGS